MFFASCRAVFLSLCFDEQWYITYATVYAIAWDSLRGALFLRGACASRRGEGFAYAAMPFLFSIVALGFGTTSHKYHN